MKLKEMFATKNMTEGEPYKRILEFAIPMLIGNVAQQLYNTADSVIVGKYIGDNALAAVGSSMPILTLMFSLFIGISTGASIVTSQMFGAKNRKGLSKSIGNCLVLSAIVSLIIMVVGTAITEPMLRLLNTPASILDWCKSYLTIFFLGIAGSIYYNILAGLLRGMGDSISALLFLLISAGLNIFLDIYFISQLGMGVEGASLATVLSQGISAVLCLIKLMNMKNDFDLNLESLKLDPNISGRIIKLGLPTGITQAIMATANMFVQNLTNSMGEMVIAANVLVMRVDGFAMMPNFSFGNAMSVFTGQNVGAGKEDRIALGKKQGQSIVLGLSTAIVVVLIFASPLLFRIFTKTPELIQLATNMIRIMAIGYIWFGLSQVLLGIMRGAGDTMTPMYQSIISTILIRVPLAYLFASYTKSELFPHGSPYALSTSLLISWVAGAIMAYFLFKNGKWRERMHRSMSSNKAK
ncbi:MAG: MATE family efflux transporter [Erysipelotrichaceae bacterium]|nr:MATE family efflux transporter [Erysipelotrichaceae bacterium]